MVTTMMMTMGMSWPTYIRKATSAFFFFFTRGRFRESQSNLTHMGLVRGACFNRQCPSCEKLTLVTLGEIRAEVTVISLPVAATVRLVPVLWELCDVPHDER